MSPSLVKKKYLPSRETNGQPSHPCVLILSLILNEVAVARIGWDDPIGKKLVQVFGEARITYTVIGVVKDFESLSLEEP